MKLKHVMLMVGAVACIAAGFLLAQRLLQGQMETASRQTIQEHQRELEGAHEDAKAWADAVTKSGSESLLRAFVAGVTPAVLAGRRESIELAATGLLRVPGVNGIHVLGTEGDVLYSSDAKLATTGDTTYRGSWALEAMELMSRESSRPGVVEHAMPIANGEQRLAVVWLEFDVTNARDAARPASLGSPPVLQRGDIEDAN